MKLSEEYGTKFRLEGLPESRQILIQRLGREEEVADAVVMFITCGYITGQSLLMYNLSSDA